MRRFIPPTAMLAALCFPACNGGGGGWPFGNCGDYTIRSPTAGIDEPAQETCTSGQGSWGTWDLMEDGYAVLYMGASEYDDAVGWFEIEISFPNTWLLEEGATFEPYSMAGMYAWGTGEGFDWVPAMGKVEITVERIGTDYDEIWEEAYFRLSWKGQWGDPAEGPYYTAEGEDWIGLLDAPDVREP